jgi:hypothetical protein
MSKGILTFAFNNSDIDYVAQAEELAKRAKEHLGLSVSIVTDSIIDSDIFDQVIPYEVASINNKRYYNGALSNINLNFKNDARPCAYDLSPYSETLLLDTDYVIADSILLNCFEQKNNFLIYKDAVDLAGHRNYKEFQYVSDTGIEFYWATAVFFRKTLLNKIFFDLLKHIKENWIHYKHVYQIEGSTYRNDHAFSIAIHVMNGFQKGNFAKSMPGKLLYITDKDLLTGINKSEFTFLLEKQNKKGEYTLAKTKDQSVHIMNKFSLDRFIKNE